MIKKTVYLLLFCFAFNHANAQNANENPPDSIGTFSLGDLTVSFNITDPIFNTVKAKQLETFARSDAAQALNLLPGVTLSKVGQRNEAMLYLRGFDLRRVPVLIDGIPVYVPYDGYVDLARFTTFDLAEIQVSKNYTSVNYGPNSMGGAINLITRKPIRKLELNGATGWQDGGFRSNFNFGSKQGKFYLQAGLSKFKRDYYPMSKDFTPTSYEDGHHRDNSYSDDEKVSLKVAYEPNEKSEYAISYAYQHGNKGTPVYTGSDTLNSLYKKPRYWRWPKWDKQSIAFLSNSRIDSTQSVKTRIYYDQFINTLDSYDDNSYKTMDKPYAFSSRYNDYTIGAIVEYKKIFGQIDNLAGSLQYKQDVHREHNVGEPIAKMSDVTTTAAVENRLKLTDQLRLLTGFSFSNRSSLTAQNYNSDLDKIIDFPSNHNNAVNLQSELQYSINKNNILNFSVARKTRFATTKDRYSFSMGTALPNPDLKAEYTTNYNLSYSSFYLNNILEFNVAAFYSKINNTILSVNNVAYDSITETSLSQLQNVGQSEYMGVELGVNYNPVSPISTGINYTFIKRNNITNPDIYFIDVPRSKLFGFIEYKIKTLLSLQVNAEYDSKRYSTSYGTTANAFTLFNGSARVPVWKFLSLEAGVNNIFDENYSLTEGFPEPGRNFFVNLNYHL